MNAPVTPESTAAAVHADALARFNAADPAARLEYSNTITRKHCPDLAARVREQFDEPFEQQHVCWELNSVQGPWAEHDSGGRFRWLAVKNTDLDAVVTGADFLRMVYRHLVPA